MVKKLTLYGSYMVVKLTITRWGCKHVCRSNVTTTKRGHDKKNQQETSNFLPKQATSPVHIKRPYPTVPNNMWFYCYKTIVSGT
jgi:hypothetical protein